MFIHWGFSLSGSRVPVYPIQKTDLAFLWGSEMNTRMTCVLAMQRCMMNLQSPCIRDSFLHVIKNITVSEPKHYSDSSTLHHVYNTGKQELGFRRIVQMRSRYSYNTKAGCLVWSLTEQNCLFLHIQNHPDVFKGKPSRWLNINVVIAFFTQRLLYVINAVIWSHGAFHEMTA